MPAQRTLLRRAATALLAVGAASVAFVGVGAATAPVAAASTACADLLPGAGNSGFTNTNTTYTTYASGGFQYVAGSRVTLDLEGAGNCDAPGSRFVRVQARLWDGTGAVMAFVDQSPSGFVPGTPVVVDPSGFFNPAISNIKNVAGQTVRPCGHFVYNGVSEVRCGAWTTVPA